MRPTKQTNPVTYSLSYMKHKINASQTRKAELNIHPLGLISKHPCKHFLFHNMDKIIPKKVNLDFLNIRLVSFAVADAKHSTGSETTVQIESQT